MENFLGALGTYYPILGKMKNRNANAMPHSRMLSRQRVLPSWLPTVITWDILKGTHDWATPPEIVI